MPPEEIVAPDDLSERRYYFDQFREFNEPIDHFSCHADGSFFLKGRHAPPIYSHTLRRREPLGPNARVFLEFTIKTDVAVDYPAARPSKIRNPVVIDVPYGAGLQIYGVLAGQDRRVESFIDDAIRQPGWSRGPVFSLGVFRGALASKPYWPDALLVDSRPRGTFVALRFLTESGVYRHKTFMFG